MEITNLFLLLLAIVAISPKAYSKPESLWGRGVFPDDEHLPSPPRRKHLESSDVETKEQNDKVCEAAGCKIIADEFLSSINEKVNPCDDFYEFTCGGWNAKNVIPPDSPVWSRFMIFDNTAKHRIKGVLESEPEPSDILPVRQAKKWYRSCMDTENLERRGLTPIESILMQVGGWPITVDEEEWDSEEYTWQRVERDYVRLTGTDAFFKVEVYPRRAPNHGFLHLAPQLKTLSEQLPMSYRNYSGNDYEAYVKLVESAAEMFVQHNHANVPKEKLAKEAREIVEFEKELHELESKRFSYDEVVFKDLEDWYGNLTENNTDTEAKIDLTSLIEGLFETANIELEPDAELMVSDSKYINGLGELLKRTPGRTIVNYIHWTFVGNMLVYTTESVRNNLLAFAWEQFGVKQRRPRWAECVDEMKMTHAAAYVFVEKYFTKSTENAAVEMVENIRKEMEEKIENSSWLDEESKTIAKEKLNRMRVFLGFPDWYKNKTAIINYYKGITIGSEFFDNTLGYIRYQRKNDMKKYLPSDGEKEVWFMDPITVNALYSPEDNLLNLPAVDFQAPLFTRQLPDAVNYGVAGVIVGHEIGHGFDDSGIRYGVDGNETELSEKILKSYYQLADCFTDQFEEYYREEGAPDSDGTTPKGQFTAEKKAQITRGENIADTTGIQAVFKAYRKVKEQSGTSRLPGLEKYTEDQLFFMSFGSVWCKVETPQLAEKSREFGDVHSPAKLRVLGAISNTEDFARVFKCEKGSAMNPTNKCDIWKKSEAKSEDEKSSLRRKDLPWETQWKH